MSDKDLSMWNTAQLEEATVSIAMDPRLQRVLARRKRGILEHPTVSSVEDEVAVIAEVDDLDGWLGLSEVLPGAVIASEGEEGAIVTARVPVSRLEAVRRRPGVLSLKAAQPLRMQLAETLNETNAALALLPASHSTDGGRGVVVGIVDYGCDIAHKNFLLGNGKTRIESIWAHNGTTSANSPFGYGREFRREEIDAALQTTDPYGSLGYAPPFDFQMGTQGTHGTHVMDIAAGNGNGSGQPGVAPNADLIFVDVAGHADLPANGPEVVNTSFGDSTRLLESIAYIFDKAGDRPCVINVSLGTNGGPHDGTTLVERGIDRLVRAAPNRAVVIAAGNSHEDETHTAGQVPDGSSVDLSWEIPSNDTSHNEMEIWFSGEDEISVELLLPNGTSLGTVSPGNSASGNVGEEVAVFIANRQTDPNNQDNVIGLFLESGVGLPPGEWTVRLHGDRVRHGGYHAWIERDNRAPSRFSRGASPTHTIGSVSCGQDSIAVGSYDAHKATTPISWFSSAGPTRDGRQKPELSAPGHAVLAARSRTLTGVTRKSGTSMAAPAVTGIIALVYAQALYRGRALDIGELRELLFEHLRESPPPAPWDGQFGGGRIDASASLADLV